ncbi:hypothetical protein B7494_g3052 [Chlorociboria aeruginascens]|nr:hypothetical protein B7494_g3052 [Chlorociboria aeruginascens]
MIVPKDQQGNGDTSVTTNGNVTQCPELCPELKKILPSTLYLTFNTPQVDEYHRGLFLTSPPTDPPSVPHTVGMLFHAKYGPPPSPNPSIGSPASPPSTPSSPSDASMHLKRLILVLYALFYKYFYKFFSNSVTENSSALMQWTLEERPVQDLSRSNNLVLLYRVCSVATALDAERMKNIFNEIPLGKSSRDGVTGNPKLGDYDCIVWTTDALDALEKKGLIQSDKSPADIMACARSEAGPPDAREMVGKDFGGLRVINEDPSHSQRRD